MNKCQIITEKQLKKYKSNSKQSHSTPLITLQSKNNRLIGLYLSDEAGYKNAGFPQKSAYLFTFHLQTNDLNTSGSYYIVPTT